MRNQKLYVHGGLIFLEREHNYHFSSCQNGVSVVAAKIVDSVSLLLKCSQISHDQGVLFLCVKQFSMFKRTAVHNVNASVSSAPRHRNRPETQDLLKFVKSNSQ